MFNKSFPTFIGIITLVIGVFVGVFLVDKQQTVKLGADGSIQPISLRISNISDNSFTVSWISAQKTSAAINWKEEGSIGSEIQEDTNTVSSFIHHITIDNLKQNTKYQFEIISNGEVFTNYGEWWTVKTGRKLLPNSNSLIVSGKVLSPAKHPVPNTLVNISLRGSNLSTTTSADGDWVIQLSNARIQSLDNYISIDESMLADIVVQASVSEITSSQFYPARIQELPPIIFGKVNDFRNIETYTESLNPEAEIIVPQDLPQSRFDTSE